MEVRAVSDLIRLSASAYIQSDFDRFLEQALKCLSEELTVNYSSFWFHDAEKDNFSCIKCYDWEEKLVQSTPQPIRTKDYFDILPLIQSSEILHQSNSEDKSWNVPQLGKLLNEGVNSWVCFPLKGGNSLLGFLLIADKNKRIYDIDDQNILCCVGSLIRESIRTHFKFEAEQEKVFGIPEVESSKIDDFIFYTAHNLRHPITNLLALIDLSKQLKDEDQVEEILSLLKMEVLKLDDVVRVMIAKIEQDEYKV